MRRRRRRMGLHAWDARTVVQRSWDRAVFWAVSWAVLPDFWAVAGLGPPPNSGALPTPLPPPPQKTIPQLFTFLAARERSPTSDRAQGRRGRTGLRRCDDGGPYLRGGRVLLGPGPAGAQPRRLAAAGRTLPGRAGCASLCGLAARRGGGAGGTAVHLGLGREPRCVAGRTSGGGCACLDPTTRILRAKPAWPGGCRSGF